MKRFLVIILLLCINIKSVSAESNYKYITYTKESIKNYNKYPTVLKYMLSHGSYITKNHKYLITDYEYNNKVSLNKNYKITSIKVLNKTFKVSFKIKQLDNNSYKYYIKTKGIKVKHTYKIKINYISNNKSNAVIKKFTVEVDEF